MKHTSKRLHVTLLGLGLLGLATTPLGSGSWAPVERVIEYHYDAVDRLTDVTYDGTLNVSYRYDAGGNLLEVEVAGRQPARPTGVDGRPRPAAVRPGPQVRRAPDVGSAERR